MNEFITFIIVNVSIFSFFNIISVDNNVKWYFEHFSYHDLLKQKVTLKNKNNLSHYKNYNTNRALEWNSNSHPVIVENQNSNFLQLSLALSPSFSWLLFLSRSTLFVQKKMRKMREDKTESTHGEGNSILSRCYSHRGCLVVQ